MKKGWDEEVKKTLREKFEYDAKLHTLRTCKNCKKTIECAEYKFSERPSGHKIAGVCAFYEED